MLSVVSAYAQTEAISPAEIEKRWPSDRGILFICDPYCEFVALKEVSQWKPDLTVLPGKIENLKLICPEDPKYPLLIAELPIFPYIEKKNPPPPDEDHRLTVYERKKISDGETWLWWLKVGPEISTIKISSDTAILSQAEPKAMQSGLSVLGEFRFLKVWSLGKFNFRPAFFLDYGSLGAAKTDLAENNVSRSHQNLGLELRTDVSGYQGIFNLEYRMEHFISQQTVLNSYGFDQQQVFASIGIGGPDWYLIYGRATSAHLNEKQNFRSEPLTLEIQELKGEKCTGKLKNFGMDFTFCFQGRYAQNLQKSGVNPGLITGISDTKIQFDETSIRATLKLGDDLWL